MDWLVILGCIIYGVVMQVGVGEMTHQMTTDELTFSRKLYPDLIRGTFVISLLNGFSFPAFF
jgi:amino acid permease